MKCIGWGLKICTNERYADKKGYTLYCESCERQRLEHEKMLTEEGIEDGCFENEDEITCPYCGYKEKDSWEAPDADDDYACMDCGKEFKMERVVTVTYSTWKKESEDEG